MTSLMGGSQVAFSERAAGGSGVLDAGIPTVALSAGAGVFYGLDSEHAGQIVTDDAFQLRRTLLEACPAVNIASRVVSRLLEMVDMRLLRPDGSVYAPRRMHPVLKLWNDRPNEFQSAREFRAQIGQEIVYTGEIIARVNRDGSAPRRIYVWDASNVSCDFYSGVDVALEDVEGVTYQYGETRFMYDPGMPQVLHVRQNPHPLRTLRGRPAVYGMRHEVLSNIYATLYRTEVFRQGGPPRLVLIQKDGSGVPGVGAGRPQPPPPSTPASGGKKSTPPKSQQEMSHAASLFTKTVKSPQAYRETAVMPPGWEPVDLGPKSNVDPLLVGAARHTDEKLLAAYGIPVNFANNLERATYSNIRSEDRRLVRDAIAPVLDLIAGAVERDLLRPMGGINATLRVGWDLDAATQPEAIVWNNIQISRYKNQISGLAEVREALGYDPAEPDDLLELPAKAPGAGGPSDAPITEQSDTPGEEA